MSHWVRCWWRGCHDLDLKELLKDPEMEAFRAALGILQGLQDKGVDLFLHQQGLDTSTTAGKAMFQMLGVFAEFERGIIRERVNAGLARARQNGTKLGRRRVKPSVEATIRELRAEGDGILKIARTLGVGTSVVQRVILETA